MNDEEIVHRAIICDTFRKVFNSLRCGSSADRIKQVMTARLRFWATKDRQYPKYLRNWIGNEVYERIVRPSAKKKARRNRR